MGWIRDLMDIVGWAQETRQRDVETKLAEAELASKQQVLAIATLDDVQQYDPKFRELTARVEAARARPGLWRSSGTALVVGLIGTGSSALLVFLLGDHPGGMETRSPPAAAAPDLPSTAAPDLPHPAAPDLPRAAAPHLPRASDDPPAHWGGRQFSAVRVVGDIYVRSGPGMRYAPIGYVPAGSVLVLERPNERGWSRVLDWTDVVYADGVPVTRRATGYIYSRSAALRLDPIEF